MVNNEVDGVTAVPGDDKWDRSSKFPDPDLQEWGPQRSCRWASRWDPQIQPVERSRAHGPAPALRSLSPNMKTDHSPIKMLQLPRQRWKGCLAASVGQAMCLEHGWGGAKEVSEVV